ncbi:MAG: triose-phosphate isomerase [Chitinophagales bacterium]|nr:triose-phosphate isomerase [Chitinophagales bacterium]
MARKFIVAGNWKMHTTIDEGIQLATQIQEGQRNANTTVILGVPFTHLFPVKKKLKAASKIHLAAQNCHYKNSGAFTGEVSPATLAALKIPYVILGHSERRLFNHEDDALLALKIQAALENGLKVIFCCGEPLEIRKAGDHVKFVQKQLEASLFAVPATDMKNIIIAYEPIWAIGTGETASPNQAQEIHLAIRNMLKKQYGKRIADNTSILYGGSVKSSNAKEIFGQPDVDGGLVGGAALDSQEFLKIINSQ